MNTGALARNAGQAQVLAHNDTWRLVASTLVAAYIRRFGPCLIEEARDFCDRAGMEQPSHPNAWGALIGTMARDGAIQMTGGWEPSRAPKSHARLQPLWFVR